MKKNLLKFSGLTLALVAAVGISGCASTGGGAKPLEVGITADIQSVEVMHGGREGYHPAQPEYRQQHQSGLCQDFTQVPAVLHPAG